MKIIIPMAGWGSRLRPHTLTVPKPMVKIAGKPIVERLAETLIESVDDYVEEIHFVIREDFGKEIEKKLEEIASRLKTKAIISYQKTPEGTAHAIYCAKESLNGNVIIAFADTLFDSKFKLDPKNDGVIWVSKVEDPKAFGVVKLNNDNVITDFVEKPQKFVSDLAIIGIYYFKEGEKLQTEIKYLLDNNLKEKGEYQITNALENLKKKGAEFIPGEVKEWLDCGNKNACVYSNNRILELVKEKEKLTYSKDFANSVVIEPCFIGENVIIENSIVGPHVSISKNTVIKNSIVKNSIIQQDSILENVNLKDSMIGKKVSYKKRAYNISLGDYSSI